MAVGVLRRRHCPAESPRGDRARLPGRRRCRCGVGRRGGGAVAAGVKCVGMMTMQMRQGPPRRAAPPERTDTGLDRALPTRVDRRHCGKAPLGSRGAGVDRPKPRPSAGVDPFAVAGTPIRLSRAIRVAPRLNRNSVPNMRGANSVPASHRLGQRGFRRLGIRGALSSPGIQCCGPVATPACLAESNRSASLKAPDFETGNHHPVAIACLHSTPPQPLEYRSRTESAPPEST